MQLLFERFISRERNEPPDIDVDFEHQRREEVIQYIYKKYGRDRAVDRNRHLAYRPRSGAARRGQGAGARSRSDPPGEVDGLVGRRAGDGAAGEGIGLSIRNRPVMKHLFKLVETILGFPRHLSQHTGGFRISRGPLSELVPIENAAMPDRTVIEWDKDDLDALGLLKVDVLALGMLSAIRRALELVSARRGRPSP